MVKFFGTTFQETISAFQSADDLSPANSSNAQTAEEKNQNRTFAIVRIVITFLLIGIGAYLAAKNDSGIGSTLLGAVAGYWLK